MGLHSYTQEKWAVFSVPAGLQTTGTPLMSPKPGSASFALTMHPSELAATCPLPPPVSPALPSPPYQGTPLPQPPLLFFNYFSILLSLYGRRRKGEQPLPGACSSPGGQAENFGVRQERLREAPAGLGSCAALCGPSRLTLMKVIPAGIGLRPASVSPPS